MDCDLLAALHAVVGDRGLLRDPDLARSYEVAARYGAGRAAAVVRPANAEETSRVVACCVRRGVPFVPRSGGTGLVLGSTPDASGEEVVVSLDRLRAPLRIDPADRTATVGAGVRLSALEAAAEPLGLTLPIDLGADPMVGGMAATNAAGARFIRYGDMRRHVLGLEVVLADTHGTRARLGRGLRKDNSALALGGLLVGGCGAFGIITEATIELRRRPRDRAAALLVPRDASATLELLMVLESEVGEELTAFEGMSAAAMRRALSHVPNLRNPFPNGRIPPYAVLVELSRSGRSDAPLSELLEAVLADAFASPSAPLTDAFIGPPDHVWALRHAIPEGLRASGRVIGFDLAFRRADVLRFRAAAAKLVEERFADFEVCDFGHVGDGGVHFNLVRTDADGPSEAEEAALREAVLDLAVADFGGSFSGEHGVGRANQSAYDRHTPAIVQDLSERVRAAWGVRGSAATRFGPPETQRPRP